MPGLIKKLYSPPLIDALFAVAGTMGVVGIVVDMTRSYPAVERAVAPLAKGGSLLGALLASVLLAVVSTRADQKLADDFLYHTMTKSAFIAMFAVFFTLALWEVLLADRLGGVSSYAVVGLIVAAWSLSYFYTRLRGTRA